MEIEEARELYEQKKGKPVPNNKKNKLEWILGQLEEEPKAEEPKVEKSNDDRFTLVGADGEVKKDAKGNIRYFTKAGNRTIEVK